MKIIGDPNKDLNHGLVLRRTGQILLFAGPLSLAGLVALLAVVFPSLQNEGVASVSVVVRDGARFVSERFPGRHAHLVRSQPIPETGDRVCIDTANLSASAAMVFRRLSAAKRFHERTRWLVMLMGPGLSRLPLGLAPGEFSQRLWEALRGHYGDAATILRVLASSFRTSLPSRVIPQDVEQHPHFEKINIT